MRKGVFVWEGELEEEWRELMEYGVFRGFGSWGVGGFVFFLKLVGSKTIGYDFRFFSIISGL